MAKFQPALSLVLKHEGGLAQNAMDSGGITNFGISFAFYKKRIKPDANESDIRNLTIQQASDIYEKYFWNRADFADIIDQNIANRLFDLSVNLGQAQAITLLQRALNMLKPTLHLILDGSLGGHTLNATNNANPEKLYEQLILEAESFYKKLVAKHPQDGIFLAGWLHRLHSVTV